MDRTTAIRFVGLYFPVLTAIVLAMLRPRDRRLTGAILVGAAWTLPTLLALQLMNLRFDWWSFQVQGGTLRELPVDLWLGWTALWGAIPVLAFRRLRLVYVVGIFFAIDLFLMPLCAPAVILSPSWLMGELVALAFVLIPATLFSRWTLEDSHLGFRISLQILTAGWIFLFLMSEVVFGYRVSARWAAVLNQSAWLSSLELQVLLLLALPGVSAVQEFALRGRGTPIPYDPPKRLVVSGVYRYIANPMQLSCALVIICWATLLRNLWIESIGIMSLIYSAGLANWDEAEDLKERFGESWVRYRQNVRAWRVRWRPWHDPAQPLPRLYIAESCGECSEVRRWFEKRNPSSLEIVAAEDHPVCELMRMTYDPMDGSLPETGVRAFARGLEHLHLAWALVGASLRLPGISHLVQLLIDAAGFGPQKIARRRVAG